MNFLDTNLHFCAFVHDLNEFMRKMCVFSYYTRKSEIGKIEFEFPAKKVPSAILAEGMNDSYAEITT